MSDKFWTVSTSAAVAGGASLSLAPLTLLLGAGNLIVLDLAFAVGMFLIVLALTRYARAGNILLVAHLMVVLLFSVFALIVLNVIDYVAVDYEYDYSVFSLESVVTVLALNMSVLGMSFLVYSFFPQLGDRTSLFRLPDRSVFHGRRIPTANTRFNVWIAVSWMIIIAVTFLTPNILQFPYPVNAEQPGNLHATIRVFLVLIPLGVLIAILVTTGFEMSRQSVIARATFYAAVAFIGILHGARGAMTGMLLAITTMDLLFSRASTQFKVATLTIDVLYIMFLVFNWAWIRVNAVETGFLQAFLDSFQNYRDIFEFRSINTGEVHLADVPMLGQSLFHFLSVVALIDSGVSLNYQTFINLLPQQLPEMLDGVLWDRPLNDNWILGEYFTGGGGFYVYANAYWNGGIVPMSLFALGLAWCVAKIEILFKGKDYSFAIAYFAFIFLLPVNIYYGIQGLVRGLEYGLITYIVIRWWHADRFSGEKAGAYRSKLRGH